MASAQHLRRVLGARLLSTRPSTAAAVLRPSPELGEWISDAPDTLSAPIRQHLNQRMTALSESKRGQMAIVLVDDIAGASTAAGIEKYGRFTEAVFDLWGVGRKDVNDGVLIAVYLEGRRIEVRTGAGARVALPDGWLEDMQHGEMVPHFRAGNPGRGVLAGATAILDRLDASSTPLEGGGAAAASVPVPTERHEFGLGRVRSRPAVQRPSERRYTYEEGSGSLPLVMFLLLNVSASVIAVNSFLEDRRRRRCRTPGCEALMDRVGSELDGQSALTPGGRWTAGPEALTACELDERRVGSVRWTLLRCAKCGAERCAAAWLSRSLAPSTQATREPPTHHPRHPHRCHSPPPPSQRAAGGARRVQPLLELPLPVRDGAHPHARPRHRALDGHAEARGELPALRQAPRVDVGHPPQREQVVVQLRRLRWWQQRRRWRRRGVVAWRRAGERARPALPTRKGCYGSGAGGLGATVAGPPGGAGAGGGSGGGGGSRRAASAAEHAAEAATRARLVAGTSGGCMVA